MKAHKGNRKFLFLGLLVLFLILIVLFLYSMYQREQYKEFVIKDINALRLIRGEYYSGYTDEYKKIELSFKELFFKGPLPATNLQAFDIKDTASGDDILSESLGLMMLIALKEKDLDQFENLRETMNQSFLKENGLLKWRLQASNNHDEIVNATIDDLRVVKALYEASELWNKPIYKEKALEIGNALYKYCTQDDVLTSYDAQDSPDAILTYYDFKAMLYLYGDDKRWANVILKGIGEVYRCKIEGRPFYKDNKGDNAYRSIENLMILQHLYEVGLKDDKSIAFIREQMNLGGYYAAYSKQGQVKDPIESPAIYGIIAQIAQLADDEALYHMVCQKILTLTNQTTEQYAWAFVDDKTHVGYSFDHLMALLGL